jgi:hypothetical protein
MVGRFANRTFHCNHENTIESADSRRRPPIMPAAFVRAPEAHALTIVVPAENFEWLSWDVVGQKRVPRWRSRRRASLRQSGRVGIVLEIPLYRRSAHPVQVDGGESRKAIV